MSALSFLGWFSVVTMLVFYALEERSHWFTLCFALSCFLASIYGFLQGAKPIGWVELAWTVVVFRKWWQVRK